MQINRQSGVEGLTLHGGDLLVHRPAGQRVFQGVEVDFVGSCNLSETIKRDGMRRKKLRQQERETEWRCCGCGRKSSSVVQVFACAPDRNENACIFLNYRFDQQMCLQTDLFY